MDLKELIESIPTSKIKIDPDFKRIYLCLKKIFEEKEVAATTQNKGGAAGND